MRVVPATLHSMLLALLVALLLPLAAAQGQGELHMRLALKYSVIAQYDLNSVDKILENALAFLSTSKGEPNPNKEKEIELMKSALRIQIKRQFDQLNPDIIDINSDEEIEIFFPSRVVHELYGESALPVTEEAAVIQPDYRPPPSPPGHQKWGDDKELTTVDITRDESQYATTIDHDAILQSLGWETTTFADYPSVCDSDTNKILMSLTKELDLPNSFRLYECERLVQELKQHRLTSRWSERAVLEEFFFALTGFSPEDEVMWKNSRLVTSGKWLREADHCSWEGITCGITTVGPGRGMLDDEDDTTCSVIAGVKTCTTKKSRCDGKMGIDQLLGITCPHKTAVTKIDLTSLFLSGTLISNLYMLTNLHRLNLMKNKIHGTVPESFSEFKKLEFLDVSDNAMTSQLPRNLPSTLEEVWFENNAFTGSIPDDFERFKNLRFIDISGNQITGTIPAYFAEMTRLNSLALAGNKLIGSIPDFDAQSIDVLDFSDNELTGMPDLFPPDLSELRLGSNQLRGPFPASKLFQTLTELNMTGNHFTGEVPTKLDLDDSELYLSLWRLFGCDKTTLCKSGHDILCSPGYFSPIGAVSELGPCQRCPLSEDESKKKLLGRTTCSSKDYIAGDVNGDGVLSEREILQLFYVFTNGREWDSDFRKPWEDMNTPTCNLPGIGCNSDGEVNVINPRLPDAELCGGSSGTCFGLPSELGLLKSLTMLVLSGASKLTGTLPSELGQLEKLEILKCDKCVSLTGTIPTSFGNMKSLKIMDVSSSGLTGSLPSELGQLSNLMTLNLSLNSFSGSIPSTFTQMKLLKQLILSRCKLSGRIPEDIGQLQQLENLELYGNNLTGSIPLNLSGMTSLKRLDVFSNKLTSSIPSELGQLKNLQIIHMKENSLSGTISAAIAKLPSLTWLDISDNNITGMIDPAFGTSSSLIDLKLGGNKLHGPIPNTLCSNKKLNGGLTSQYGCDAILCPIETYSPIGFASSSSECKPCPSGKISLHLGASSCVTISQKEILEMFFDVMGGPSWDEDQRRGWKITQNECEWSGVSCDSNGEINMLSFQMR